MYDPNIKKFPITELKLLLTWSSYFFESANTKIIRKVERRKQDCKRELVKTKGPK